MKKTIIISAVVIALIVAFFTLYFVMTAPKYRGEFSISEFSEEIADVNFQVEKNYGKIDDYKSAAEAGKTAIAERFEHSSGSIFEWMGCDILYDKANDAYYVRTYHLTPFLLGGAYDVILKSDGTVLAIWGEK